MSSLEDLERFARMGGLGLPPNPLLSALSGPGSLGGLASLADGLLGLRSGASAFQALDALHAPEAVSASLVSFLRGPSLLSSGVLRDDSDLSHTHLGLFSNTSTLHAFDLLRGYEEMSASSAFLQGAQGLLSSMDVGFALDSVHVSRGFLGLGEGLGLGHRGALPSIQAAQGFLAFALQSEPLLALGTARSSYVETLSRAFTAAEAFDAGSVAATLRAATVFTPQSAALSGVELLSAGAMTDYASRFGVNALSEFPGLTGVSSLLEGAYERLLVSAPRLGLDADGGFSVRRNREPWGPMRRAERQSGGIASRIGSHSRTVARRGGRRG